MTIHCSKHNITWLKSQENVDIEEDEFNVLHSCPLISRISPSPAPSPHSVSLKYNHPEIAQPMAAGSQDEEVTLYTPACSWDPGTKITKIKSNIRVLSDILMFIKFPSNNIKLFPWLDITNQSYTSLRLGLVNLSPNKKPFTEPRLLTSWKTTLPSS